MRRCFGLILVYLLCQAPVIGAQGTYQEPEDFLAEAFDGRPPESSVIWMTGGLKETVEEIMGHRYASLRVRYWRRGAVTAWILEEIGKERPITTGLVVKEGELARLKVLIYRESRGWEVRHEFFTDQFKGAMLTGDLELDRNIDGITGATLSVRAMKKLARLALYLHDTVVSGEDEEQDNNQ